ncbi:MAG: hydroxyethylthiazole kinase [Bilophila wadsworthia]
MHFITNYVTVNDCANMTLALGGSPLADDLREVEQIVGHCSALVLNIGTLSERTVQSMLAAGRSQRLGRPVVFDPLGVGASHFAMKQQRCCSGSPF